MTGTKIALPNEGRLSFTSEQHRMIRDSFLNGASDLEAAVLIEVARIRRLNPLLGQIHFVKRWDALKQREVWAAQVAIDGFRAIAERTGAYAGQDEPEFAYDDKGTLLLARVRVYRKDIERPFVGVARTIEFAQTKRDGGLTHMWAKMPHNQTAKCAEAQAFRKAFPEELSGLYAPEELPGEVLPVHIKFAVPANDTALAVDRVGEWTARLNQSETVDALRGVAADIRKEPLDPAQRRALLDVYNARLCVLRSTPGTEGEPLLPGTEG
jgi:phage recombination protein Bet